MTGLDAALKINMMAPNANVQRKKMHKPIKATRIAQNLFGSPSDDDNKYLEELQTAALQENVTAFQNRWSYDVMKEEFIVPENDELVQETRENLKTLNNVYPCNRLENIAKRLGPNAVSKLNRRAVSTRTSPYKRPELIVLSTGLLDFCYFQKLLKK